MTTTSTPSTTSDEERFVRRLRLLNRLYGLEYRADPLSNSWARRRSSGAEIRVVSLSRDTDSGTITATLAAILCHRIIFLRNRHLDDNGHEVLVGRLGRPEICVPDNDNLMSASRVKGIRP